MAKRNLLSKLIAGIGALAMVATMMPAMAQPALAAETLTITKPNVALNEGSFKVYEIDKTEYEKGIAMNDGNRETTVSGYPEVPFGPATAPARQESTKTSWTNKDVYLLIVPDMFYEYVPKGVEGNTLTLVNAGTGASGWYNAYENPQDTSKGGKSWVMWIDASKFDKADLSNIDQVKLHISVKGGEGVTIAQSNGPEAERNTTFSERVYTMYWDKNIAGYNAANTMSNVVIKTPVGGVTNYARDLYISTALNDKIYKTGGELDAGHTGEKRITLQAAKTGNMDMKINGTYIQKHQLVSQKIKASSTVNDTNVYIELGNGKDATQTDLRPFSKENNGTKPYTYTWNESKEEYDNIIRGGEVKFSLWWDNLWALYWHGLDTDNSGGNTHEGGIPTTKSDLSAYSSNVQGPGKAPVIPSRAFPSSAYNWFIGPDRTLSIDINTTLAEGDVTFVNDAADGKTATDSVSSIYAWQFQFRDENGKRFDSTRDRVNGPTSADPARWTVEGFKEGQELAFTIKFDNMWYEGPDFRVFLTDENGNSLDITDKKGDDGVYRVKLGSGFNYTVHAEKASKKTTREVVNQPQADAVYNVNHNEPQFHKFQWWDFYAESIFVSDEWMGEGLNNCNVAEPRYMLYLQATEEDENYIDVFPFAVPRAVATTDNDYLGHDFPVGEYKFKIRFSDTFASNDVGTWASYVARGDDAQKRHGVFNEKLTDDRYGEGSDFKVTVDGQALTKDSDGLYTLKVTEGDEPIVIKVDGVTRQYFVYAPNLAGYDIEANYDLDRERTDTDVNTRLANNFRSSVPEGATYSFKIKPSDGSQKGPDFKVYLRAASDDLDRDGSVAMTEIKEGEDGSYTFTVFNDTEIVVSGITGTGFNDVSNRSAEEQEAINYLKDAGVLEGYDDGSFRPGNNLTRGEFVTMLQRLQKGTAGTASFSDTSGHWAAGAIGWASGQSVVNGYPDGSFRPNASISRAEVSQIMWKLNGSQRANMVAPFSDVNQGAWYAPAVNWNFEKGIIKGYGDGRFGTNEPIERAHMALILYRAR